MPIDNSIGTLTPQQLAKRWNCSPDKIWQLINARQLVGINTSIDPRAKRPRWAIAAAEVERFEMRRSKGASAPPTPPRRSRSTSKIRFF